MSIDPTDFLVFETYWDAGGHAFSKGVVTEDDKDRYDAVFQYLRDSVAAAIGRSTAPHELESWNCRFGRNGGIEGQRPLDLWTSIINHDSDAFSKFPQVYAIASENGVDHGGPAAAMAARSTGTLWNDATCHRPSSNVITCPERVRRTPSSLRAPGGSDA